MAPRITLAVILVFSSAVSGQLLECQTSSTQNGNAGERGCVFPFRYNGRTYDECTTENHDTLWCSTTENYDRDFQWGECICQVVNPNTPAPDPDKQCVEFTRDGAQCAPTFIFKGNTYSGCPTVANSGTPWCSLTKQYDTDKRWRNCATPLKCETPQTGTGCREKTTFNATCAPTFIYNKVSYTGCPTVNNAGVPWCSLTDNYDKDNQYGNCAVPLICATSGGGGGGGAGCIEETDFGTDCAATYIYNKRTYSGCITVNNKGVPWCSLTDNFDLDNQWANCDTPLKCSRRPSGDGCFEKTTSGAFCATEYIYNKQTYVGCTRVNNGGVAWCSLTENYDRDGEYGSCDTPLQCTSTP